VSALLDASRAALDEGADGRWGTAWPVAVALLVRQALELAVDRRLARYPGARDASMAAKLGALRGLGEADPDVLATWSQLSEVAHIGDAPREMLESAWQVVSRWG
jgi:hypothetical protein